MKKTKFLSLLVLAPLMTGCGNNVKAPEFAAYGKKISYDAFSAALLKFKSETVLYKDAKSKIGSFEYKILSQSLSTEEKTRGKEKLIDNSTFTETKGNGGYCKENLVMKGETSSKTVESTKNKDGSSSSEASSTGSSFIQPAKIGKKSYAVVVDTKAKTYIPQSVIDKDHKDADVMDGIAKDVVKSLDSLSTGFIFVYEMYKFMGEDLSVFSFHQNNKIFTCEMKETAEDETKVDDKVMYKTKSEFKWTIQIDTTEGKWSTKSYQESVETEEVKNNYNSRVAGDKKVEKSISSYEASATLKAFNAKAVDVSKYQALGVDLM